MIPLTSLDLYEEYDSDSFIDDSPEGSHEGLRSSPTDGESDSEVNAKELQAAIHQELEDLRQPMPISISSDDESRVGSMDGIEREESMDL